MAMPDKRELDRVRKKLADVEPIRLLPPNASESDRLKFQLCKKFVIYLREQKLSQVELAHRLNMDPARLSEIVKYKIELFTVDKLMEYAERLTPGKLKVTVA